MSDFLVQVYQFVTAIFAICAGCVTAPFVYALTLAIQVEEWERAKKLLEYGQYVPNPSPPSKFASVIASVIAAFATGFALYWLLK